MKILAWLKSLALTVLGDGKALLLAPFRAERKQYLKAVVFFAALALSLANDARMMEHVDFDRNQPIDKPLTFVENLGRNKVVLGIGGAALLAGKAFGGTALFEAGALIVETQVFTNLFTSTFKGVFGRNRPYRDEAPGEFEPFDFGREDRSSFPSGHAAHAFGLATAVAMRGGIYWGVPAYALAATVGTTRVLHNGHYPSDVFASAALAIYIGRILGRRQRERRAARSSGSAASDFATTFF